MSEYCVVALDARRARFFSLRDGRVPRNRSGPELREEEDLVNPESRMKDRELFSDNRTGSNRCGGGPTRRFDDHRARHRENTCRQFARRVIGQCRKMEDRLDHPEVIVSASAMMLGRLRKELAAIPGMRNWKVMRGDLVTQPMKNIQDLLARKGHIPACAPPAGTATNRSSGL
ncbi:MAG: host attachment protein [Kiritimatiellae bacterium]|nr:host attachment protein [Kiritimatiellia bacterium]